MQACNEHLASATRAADSRRETESFAASRAEATRLLVIDPDQASREHVRRLCVTSPMIEIVAAASVDDANRQGLRADGVMVDIEAAPSIDDLPATIARLDFRKADQVGLVITAQRETLEFRMAAARAGADTSMVKPISKHALNDAMRRLWRGAKRRKPRVLLISDDPDFVAATKNDLTHAGFFVDGMTESGRLLTHLHRIRPDAVIVDVGMSRFDGIALVSMLRKCAEFENTAVLCLSALVDPAIVRAAFQAGIDDFIPKPVCADILVMRLESRIERARQQRNAVEREILTGLSTRVPFLVTLENRVASALRNGTRPTLAMIDLDHFKRVNDTHGHATGDQVLAAFGQLVRQEFRDEDLKCRWGGEEFVLGFPQSHPIAVTKRLIERLLIRFRALPFRGPDGSPFSVTFSAGVAQWSDTLSSVDDLIGLADMRLYAAKRGGRARVVCEG